MIPKVELIYNYDYAKELYKGKGNFEDVWRGIIGLGADFEKIYDEYISYILESIEKYSGFTWLEHAEITFPIYLADIENSLTHPLTLGVKSDPEAMLVDLVDRLASRNMFFGFSDDAEKEKCIRSINRHIMEDLKLDKVSNEEYNLREKTIKERIK